MNEIIKLSKAQAGVIKRLKKKERLIGMIAFRLVVLTKEGMSAHV